MSLLTLRVVEGTRLPKPKGTFFLQIEAQEITPRLLALAKVCSVLGNIRDVSWHFSKQRVAGVSRRKGEHFPFLNKIKCAAKTDLGPSGLVRSASPKGISVKEILRKNFWQTTLMTTSSCICLEIPWDSEASIITLGASSIFWKQQTLYRYVCRKMSFD